MRESVSPEHEGFLRTHPADEFDHAYHMLKLEDASKETEKYRHNWFYYGMDYNWVTPPYRGNNV